MDSLFLFNCALIYIYSCVVCILTSISLYIRIEGIMYTNATIIKLYLVYYTQYMVRCITFLSSTKYCHNVRFVRCYTFYIKLLEYLIFQIFIAQHIVCVVHIKSNTGKWWIFYVEELSIVTALKIHYSCKHIVIFRLDCST